jgi:hypothetical protein
MKKNLILLIIFILLCNVLFCQTRKYIKQQNYLIYEDTGFCFISGPHLMNSFIRSNENSLEEAVRKKSFLQYVFIIGEDFKDYYEDSDELTDTINSYKSNVSYYFGKGKFNSVSYYRVAVKIKIPIESFCYKQPKKNEYTQYKLTYKKYFSKLYYLTDGLAPVFECIEFKILNRRK